MCRVDFALSRSHVRRGGAGSHCLILRMHLPGLRCLGHTFAQFMIWRHLHDIPGVRLQHARPRLGAVSCPYAMPYVWTHEAEQGVVQDTQETSSDETSV